MTYPKIMRSEQEILELIIDTARSDDRIRAVIMSGSRVNPNARRDIFQDFDIAYFVTNVDSFRNDRTWINRFGELMILQLPEAMEEPPPVNDGRFVYLMQFTDGNRIDLTLYPVSKHHTIPTDSLSLSLLDKDGIFERLPTPSERHYLPEPATARAFYDCCNEFWWVCTNVAKGLWREDIIYAKYMLDVVVREQLTKMLAWRVGVKSRFSQNMGSFGKNLKQYLEPELWVMFEKTYSDADRENTWNALFATCDLFRTAGNQVAGHFGFDYPQDDDEKVRAHLKHVHLLPKNAKNIY